MNSALRRYVSVKDWDISRSPVSLCSLMLMKGNHFLHTVKRNRWCHSSAVEFKQSDNLYSRSSWWVKPFLGSSMEGLFVFYLLITIKYLEKLFLSFLQWNLRNGMTFSPSSETSEAHEGQYFAYTVKGQLKTSTSYCKLWLSNHVSTQTPVTGEQTSESLKGTVLSWKPLLCLKSGP